MTQAIRPFVYDDDLAAVKRMWREVGWVSASNENTLDDFFAVGNSLLATIDDEPECAVHICDGTYRMQNTDLPLCAVTAVTTSRVARGYGFAKVLTARQLARGAQDGAAIAALGMFDQGFYDLVGFGTGSYANRFTIDPANLDVSSHGLKPIRLAREDYGQIHQAMQRRNKVHGGIALGPPRLMRAELGFNDEGFGLGFKTNGELTHFVWLTGSAERGPLDVRWLACRNGAQLLELLGLLKSLGDQIYSLRMLEPPEVQLQSLLRRPFRSLGATAKGSHAAHHEALAYWQARILDVSACVQALQLPGADLRFNLRLSDPVEAILDDQENGWRGVAGDYVVELGPDSNARNGTENGLEQLECSVNAFTRLILGVAPANSLAISDDLRASPELLSKLDQAIMLPVPIMGWDL